jgi:hypothetical protein
MHVHVYRTCKHILFHAGSFLLLPHTILEPAIHAVKCLFYLVHA